jgi:hypothetical protein
MNVKLTLDRFFMMVIPSKKNSTGHDAELKRLIRSLKKMEPQLINPYNDKIRPQIGTSLIELQKACSRFKSVYEQTICSNDKSTEEVSQIELLNKLMKPSSLSVKMFTFKYINEEVVRSESKIENPEDHIFKNRIAFFRGKRIKMIQKAYNENIRLSLLCGFNFEEFINLFEPHLNPETGETTLQSCRGKEALPYLKDLHYIIAGFKLDGQTLHLYKLIASLQSKIELTENNVIKDYAVVQAAVETIFTEENLIKVIKVLSVDPFIELKRYANKKTPLINMGKELAAQFTVDKDSYLKDKTESDLKESVKALFNDIPIFELEGYTSEYSAELRKHQLPGLLYITPMRILKTFLESFYYAYIDENFHEIFKELEFSSEDFKTDILKLHTNLTFVGETIKKFDEDISSPDYWDLGPFFKKSNEGNLTEPDRKEAARLVNQINKRADQIIQSVYQNFSALQKLNDKILLDLHTQESSILSNSLFMSRNKSELIYRYEKGFNEVTKCEEIIAQYTVNIDALKNKL